MAPSLNLTESTKMVDFSPLKAWRYNPEKVRQGDVLAPPYDVINDSKQQTLYERSPFNCIRLILNKQSPDDSAQDNRYSRARGHFKAWQNEKVLIQEERPAFYVYRQTFKEKGGEKARTRTALLGRLQLEDFESGRVVPHEKTLKGPREDRRKLLEETGTNFSPIFGLYSDDTGIVKSKLEQATSKKAIFDVSDDEGTRHAVWVLDDPDDIAVVHAQISSKAVYIADGHHRYQTALDFSKKKRAQKSAVNEESIDSDYVLTALVAFEDPGIVLYPTHRLIRSAIQAGKEIFKDSGAALKPLKEIFEIKEMTAEQLQNELKREDQETSFGLALSQKNYYLRVKNWTKAKEQMDAGKPDVWYALDVNVITHLILKKLWKIPETTWETVIGYTHCCEEAEKAISEKQAVAAFLLKAPKIRILQEMGEVRELMPQKSTYFYPKLASGIVFYHHQS